MKRKNGSLKPASGQKALENKEKSVLVNPFSRFTQTTDFLTKILSFKGRGSLITSKTPPKMPRHLPTKITTFSTKPRHEMTVHDADLDRHTVVAVEVAVGTNIFFLTYLLPEWSGKTFAPR